MSSSNAIDRVVEYVSPTWGAKRKASRAMLSAYEGASTGRLHASWTGSSGSADSDISEDLAQLRERSRDLVRNNGYAAGAVRGKADQVVGSVARPQSRIDFTAAGISQDAAQQWEARAEAIWRQWAPLADVTGNFDIHGLVKNAYWNSLVNGEALYLIRSLPDRPYSLALEAIESDRLGKHTGYITGNDTGVNTDKYGLPKSYSIQKTHPGEIYYTAENGYMTVPADQVIHLYRAERPGQTRGVPILAPVMSMFKHLKDYIESEVIAARITAAFALIWKSGRGAGMGQALSTSTDSDGFRIQNLNPGIIGYIGEDDEITNIPMTRPSSAYAPFVESVLRQISSAVRIPYEIFGSDYTKANFSNIRASILDFRRHCVSEQKWLARILCQRCFALLLDEAYDRRLFRPPQYKDFRHIYHNAQWMFEGWQWVDPVKDVKAAVDSISSNLSTASIELSSRGLDFEETVRQRNKERKAQLANGISDISKEINIDKELSAAGYGQDAGDINERYLRQCENPIEQASLSTSESDQGDPQSLR